MAAAMDLPPTRLLRLVQLGMLEPALRSQAIWQCVSCQTCTTRCPKSVDCAGVMDSLRQTAFEHGLASPAQRRTVLFQKAFLDNIRRNGSLPALFRDAGLAPALQKRGKLHLVGEKVRDRGLVARIFARTTQSEASR
jgi:heterodisulfide reductase subunit C